MRTSVRLVVALALVAVALAGCAKRDMDECRRGDRIRCLGEASSGDISSRLSRSG
jgi:hypothetical protein